MDSLPSAALRGYAASLCPGLLCDCPFGCVKRLLVAPSSTAADIIPVELLIARPNVVLDDRIVATLQNAAVIELLRLGIAGREILTFGSIQLFALAELHASRFTSLQFSMINSMSNFGLSPLSVANCVPK